MRIRYLPKRDSATRIAPIDIVGLNDEMDALSVWEYGQTKEIPAGLAYRKKVDGETHYIFVVDELFTLADFIDADLGYNPYFRCKFCGVETFADVIPLKGEAPEQDRKGFLVSQSLSLRDHRGFRTCTNCYGKDESKTPLGAISQH